MILALSTPTGGESWQAVVISLIVTVGGLIGVYVKQRGDGKKLSDVKDQVTNGGTNLADVVGQINRRTTLMETYLENLPSQHDIHGLRGHMHRIDGRLEHLEGRFRRHFPDDDATGA